MRRILDTISAQRGDWESTAYIVAMKRLRVVSRGIRRNTHQCIPLAANVCVLYRCTGKGAKHPRQIEYNITDHQYVVRVMIVG